MVFEGLTAADFDAFEEKKWSSHAFNRERLEVKLKLNSLGKALQVQLSAELDGQEMGITEERPSIFNQQKVRDLTLFFFRNAEARRTLGGILDKAKSMADNVMDPAPHHKHIVLGFRIRQQGAEVGLWLHRDAWVDWKNAVQRCREHYELEKLSEVLSSLPASIRYHTGEELAPDSPPARSVKADTILQEFERAQPWSIFGESVPRSDPVLGGGELPSRLAQTFLAVRPLHAFIGWRRDNDYHALKQVLREQREKAERQFTGMKAGDEVRITKGLAAGRVGVVDAVEHKGVVKVRLGPMVMAVKVEDLARP